MLPISNACYATPSTHAGRVVVTHDAAGIAPSSALPSHALNAARDGVEMGGMA
jgi:hypothetical protein